MNSTTLENEIYEFNVAFFQKYVAVTDEFAQLTALHALLIPKENYTLVSDFLNKLFSHFKTLDPKFFNPTLKKLYFDTVRLQQLLLSLELETQNPKAVFQNRFLPFSPSFGMLKKEIASHSRRETGTQRARKRFRRDKKSNLPPILDPFLQRRQIPSPQAP